MRTTKRLIASALACVGLFVMATAGTASAASTRVLAWGYNNTGQLGNGTTTNSAVALPVSNLPEVTDVSAGGLDLGLPPGEHSLALLSNGTVMAWGSDQAGQLGDGKGGGADNHSDVPVAVSGLSEVTAISAGVEHSLALRKDGTVWAWGANSSGQLGDGSTGLFSFVPVPVCVKPEFPCEEKNYLRQVVAIAAGESHSDALLKNGTVMAWGSNEFGELGNGKFSPGEKSTVAVAVSGLSKVTAISAGYADTLALLENGTVMSWGWNFQGELGNGTEYEVSQPLPGPVLNLSNVAAISACGYHSMALLKDGTVMGWGEGNKGQNGFVNKEGNPESVNVPHAVSGLSKVKAIDAGGEYSLALRNDGTVMGWGDNEFGELGDGTTTQRNLPVAAKELSGVTAISAGEQHSLAIDRLPF